MSSDNGTKIGTDNLVGDLRGDVAETREVLGDTAAGLESADVKTRTRDVMRNAAAQTREGSEHAVEQVGGSVRRHPAWWASIGAGVVAAAAAAAGVMGGGHRPVGRRAAGV